MVLPGADESSIDSGFGRICSKVATSWLTSGRSDGGSSSSDDLVPVEFRVEKQVPYGEHLVITGSSNFMGGWDITQVRACIGTRLKGVECLGV